MTESHPHMVVFVNNDGVLVDGNLLDRCVSRSQLAVVVLLCLGHGAEDGRLLLCWVSSLDLCTQLQFLKYPVCEFLISFCRLEWLIPRSLGLLLFDLQVLDLYWILRDGCHQILMGCGLNLERVSSHVRILWFCSSQRCSALNSWHLVARLKIIFLSEAFSKAWLAHVSPHQLSIVSWCRATHYHTSCRNESLDRIAVIQSISYLKCAFLRLWISLISNIEAWCPGGALVDLI